MSVLGIAAQGDERPTGNDLAGVEGDRGDRTLRAVALQRAAEEAGEIGGEERHRAHGSRAAAAGRPGHPDTHGVIFQVSIATWDIWRKTGAAT